MSARTVVGAPFIENVGQFHPAVRFKSSWGGPTVQLADDAIWLTALQETSGVHPGPLLKPEPSLLRTPTPLVGASVRISFAGANPSVILEPFDPYVGTFSYIRGRDPDRWRTAAAWNGIRLVALYPGVDIELRSTRGYLAMKASVAPGAELGAVRLLVAGAADVAVLDSGSRSIETVVGPITVPLVSLEDRPERPAVKRLGGGAFEVRGPFTDLDVVAQPQALTADLARLSYATYLGGGVRDDGWSIAVDRQRAAYVTGFTESVGFPGTPGAFSTSLGPGGLVARDAFVSKFEPTPRGVRLAYSTFLGSNTGEEDARGIAVDDAGVAHVVGLTTGDDFPTTLDAFQPTNLGGTSAFLVKLALLGDSLVYSTFIGGSGSDIAWDVAIGPDGSDFVTGSTSSPDFPVRTQPGLPVFQTRFAGLTDGFLMRLSPSGQFQWTTYLGGTGDDVSMAIDVNQDGVIAVAGLTFSEDFPVGGWAAVPRNGPIDGFVACFNPGGGRIYCRCLGGSGMDAAYAVALDVKGSAYVTGFTSSTDFPVTAGAHTPRFQGGTVFPSFISDAFVTKLWPDGRIAFSTFLGGSQDDFGTGIAVDEAGAVYVAGWTFSPNFPTTPDAYAARCGTDGNCNYVAGEYAQDIFVSVLDADGHRLLYSTFVGGSEREGARALALDPDGSVWVTGYVNSIDFPVSPDAFAPFFAGPIYDAVVVKLGWQL